MKKHTNDKDTFWVKLPFIGKKTHLHIDTTNGTYTHFTENEITGSYHNEKTDWFSIAIIAAVIFTAVVFIGEQTGFTSWLLGTV